MKFFQIGLKGVFLGHIGVADKVAVGYGAGGGVGFRVSPDTVALRGKTQGTADQSDFAVPLIQKPGYQLMGNIVIIVSDVVGGQPLYDSSP